MHKIDRVSHEQYSRKSNLKAKLTDILQINLLEYGYNFIVVFGGLQVKVVLLLRQRKEDFCV